MSTGELESGFKSVGLYQSSKRLSAANVPKQRIKDHFNEYDINLKQQQDQMSQEILSQYQKSDRSSLSLSKKSKNRSSDHSKISMDRSQINQSRRKDKVTQKRQIIQCQCKCRSKKNQSQNIPKEKIQRLQKKLKSLEKELELQKRQISLKNNEYFSSFQPEFVQVKQKHEKQFIYMCKDMVAKITRTVNPTLKYCWKFIKSNICSILKSSNQIHYEFPKSRGTGRTKNILHQVKHLLNIEHIEEIPQSLTCIIDQHQILMKIYQNVAKFFQIKVSHPYMIACYLEGLNQKLVQNQQ